MSTDSPTLRSWLKVLAPLVLVAAGLAAYSTSLDGAFVFDDTFRIVQNQALRQAWPPWHLLGGSRPVVEVSLALNYAFGGLAVRGYHVFNLAVHLVAALALLGVVRRSLPEPERPAAWVTALAVALLWELHPLLTQSVTYVIQRAESLMGMFLLLTLYAAIRAMRSPNPRLWYPLAFAACALAMGSKGVAVVAPVLVLLYDRAFAAHSFLEALRRRWGLHALLFATWLVLVRGGVLRGLFVADPAEPQVMGFGNPGVSAWHYLLTQPAVLLHYLRLSLWPSPLVLDYFWPLARSVAGAALPGLAIVLLLGLTLYASARWPRLGFPGLWFFLILAPTSSFIPLQDAAFEHRMYLSLAAVVALAVVGFQALLGRLLRGDALGGQRAVLSVVLLVVLAGVLGFLTYKRNAQYRTGMGLWRDVAAKRPSNPRAHYAVAVYAMEQNRPDLAIESLRRAIELEPQAAEARFALGVAYGSAGRIEDAVHALEEVLRAQPGHVRAHQQLAQLYDRAGQRERAREHMRRIGELTGRPPPAPGTAAGTAGAPGSDQAVEAYRQLLKARPDDVHVRIELGRTLANNMRLDEAVQELTEALQLDASSADAHWELALAYARMRRMADAVVHLRRVTELIPGELEPRIRLGGALAFLGDLAGAVAEFETAVRLHPEAARARELLEQARAELARKQAAAGRE